MNALPSQNRSRESSAGVFFAATAFVIWGISPIYWKQLHEVPAFEIVMHRVVWSPLLLLPVLAWQNRWGECAATFKSLKSVLSLLLTTVLISANWLIFIWALNHEHVLETSIGYYITPLVNVLLGMIFLRERLRRLQAAALFLAAAAVIYLTCDYGSFPWIALTLAFSFGFYGLVHKVVAISPVSGLAAEMLLLCGPAAAYLICLNGEGTGSFLHRGLGTDLLLVATALFTALPLLLFILGTKRLHLSTVGFLQYIAPSGYFLLGAFYYHEPVSRAQVWAFCLIWTALGLYSADSILFYRLAARRAA